MMREPPFTPAWWAGRDTTFAEKLLATTRVVLRHNAVCPECQVCVGGGLHGISQVFPGDDCHLGALLREADEAGL